MKEVIREGFRIVFNHFVIITTILLASMGVMKLFSGSTSAFPWYFPFQIIGVAFSTSLISLVFVSKHEQNKKEFFIRCFIHLCLLIAVVLSEGFIFRWWTKTFELLVVLLVLVIVYVGVWLFELFMDKKVSNNINKALKSIPKKDE